MKSLKVKSWNWNIENPEILEPWFKDFKSYIQSGLIKSNSERDVFRIESGGNKYVVKYSHPSSVLQKTRSSFSPKAASEFDSLQLLATSGIPVVKACGWGSCSSESMLITEELLDAESVRTYWFSEAATNDALKKEFLANFAEILKMFFNAEIYHPDFHPGNIMVQPNGLKFLLIDPYGIVKMEKENKSKIFEMLCILGAFRGEMHDDEGIELINKVCPLSSSGCSEDAGQLWNKILKHEAEKSDKLWLKRKGKALTDLRQSQVFKKNGKSIRIRKSIIGKFLVDPDKISELENADRYICKELSQEEAETKWLHSLRLQIHRLPHNYPVAWISDDSGKDKIYFEKEIKSPLSEDEIRQRYEIAGVMRRPEICATAN